MKEEAAESLSKIISVDLRKTKTKQQWDEILKKAQVFDNKESAHSLLY